MPRVRFRYVSVCASVVCASVASLTLSACGKPPVTTAVAPAAPANTVVVDTALLAAAEPFETLTEQAPSASLSTLDKLIGSARDAALNVHGYLPAAAAGQLDAQLAAMTADRQAERRTDLALASIEIYRVLVGAVSSPSKTPTPVNILDYAGFRYDADLKASPRRWGDMTSAVVVADDNWRRLSPQVTDPALRAKVEGALGVMGSAAKTQDAKSAASAVKNELDLVDKLEEFFKTP